MEEKKILRDAKSKLLEDFDYLHLESTLYTIRESYSNVSGICFLDCCRYFNNDVKKISSKLDNNLKDLQEEKIKPNSYLQIISACHAGQTAAEDS